MWEIDTHGEPVPRAHGSITERWFRDHQPATGLVTPVYELIRDSADARHAAVSALLATFWPDGSPVELLDEVGLLSATFPVPTGTGSVLPGPSPMERAYRELCSIAVQGVAERIGARSERVVSGPVRSAAARRAVLVRSGGCCEHCGLRVPDVTDAGDPILEIDHIWDLAQGGPDDPAQMIALCPNCHAIKTRGRTRESLRAELLEEATRRHEAALAD